MKKNGLLIIITGLLSFCMFVGNVFATTINNRNIVTAIPACTAEGSANMQFPCRAIIQFAKGAKPAERASVARQHGANVKSNFRFQSASAVIIPNEMTYHDLQADPTIHKILPDRVITISAPKKPGKGGGGKGGKNGQVTPEGVNRIGAAPGNISVMGQDVGVAIVDTGIDMQNQDLNVSQSCTSSFANPGQDSSPTDCQDGHGHGTHVAGIVAAIDNSVNTVGVAPQATVYAVKVLNDNGSGYDSTIIAGLEWIAAHANAQNIKVVNMSLGRPGNINDDPILRAAIKNLTDQNIVVVVAAGNDSSTEITNQIPAAYPEVFAVASTTATDGANRCRFYSSYVPIDTASYFTTDGAGVTISAPGEKQENISRACFLQSEGILSLKAGGGTIRMSGTSMAAPHVAGVVALMFEANLSLTTEQVRTIIKENATDTGVAPIQSPLCTNCSDGIAEGIVSADGAVSAAASS